MKLALWKEVSRMLGRLRSETVDFDVVDAKHRAVGGYAEIGERIEAGVGSGKWYVWTYATRAGVQFGSSFPKGSLAGSKAEAIALADKKLEAAKRRAEKNFGGGAR